MVDFLSRFKDAGLGIGMTTLIAAAVGYDVLSYFRLHGPVWPHVTAWLVIRVAAGLVFAALTVADFMDARRDGDG